MIPQRSRVRLAPALAVTAAAAMLLTACGGQQPQAAPTNAPAADADSCTAPTAQLTMATGNSTGVYYVLGGAISEVLTSETALRVTAAETGASVQNIEQLVAGDYDIAFSLADTAYDAVVGSGSFTEPQPVEALGIAHTNYMQVVVRADSGIESIADMEGMTVSTGSPGSGTEVISLRLLEAAGLTPDVDVVTQRLDLATSVDGVRNGTIDALIWSGGLPTPALTELFTTDGDAVRLIDITASLDGLQAINPVYTEGAIPADTYGLGADTPTIVIPNVLLVRDDMDEATACDITATIWGNIDRIEQVHPAGGEFDPEAAQATGDIPLAPGAARALEELAGQ